MTRILNQLSIDVYFTRVKPNLTRNEQAVLEALEEIFPASAEMLAVHLNWPINSVSGRVTGLKRKKAIRQLRRELNSRNNYVDVFVPSETKAEYDG